MTLAAKGPGADRGEGGKTQPRASQGRFLGRQPKRGNRGIYRCGACGESGHTRKCCKPLPPRPGYATGNANYQLRRSRGLCGDCGMPSKRFSRCTACRKRRKRWPSRQTTYRKERGTW